MAIWPGRVAVALGLLLLLASQSVEAACPTSFASGLECYGRGSCIADTYCQCDPGSFGEDCFFIGQAIPRGDLSSWHTPTANDAMTRVFVSGAWDTIWRSQAGHIAYYDSAEDQFYTLNVFFSGGTIRQIVRVEDELYVGGSAVVAVGLENSTNLVYYEGESGTWNEFVAAGATEAGLLSSVYAIVPNETDSSTLYLAGYFWNVGDDLSIQYAMRLDRTTKQAYQLGTSLLTFKTGGYVRDLKIVQNRYVWVGGSFEDAGGLLGNDHLACWDAWTNTWLPLATPLGDNIVQKLHYVPALDELFVVGSFNSVPWTTSEEAEYFASYSISAGQWTARNVDPNNPGSQFLTSSVDGITFDPFHNVLYLTGFSTPLSTFDLETMSFDTSYTAADLGYPSFQGTDAVLPWDADRVVLAGDNVAIFDSFRVGPLHVYRPNEQKVVALNGNDQTASGVLVDFWIHALTRTGANGMLFGGSFEFVGGVASSGYNLYNSVFWDELPSSFSDGTVKAAVSHGTTMYVARDPDVSHPCGSLTRWNQATGWECLPNFPALGNAPIYALHLLNDTLYIGGDFLFLDGVDGASYCVEYHIDTETWGLIAPNVQLDDSVQAFTSSGVFLYMVGLFTRVEAATDAVGLAVLNTETKTWITYPQYANVPEFASNANPFAAVSIYPLDAEDNPQFIITNGEIFGVSLSSNTTAKYNAIYQPATGLMYLFDSVLATFGAPQMSCDVGDLQFICGDMTSNTTQGNYVWAWDWGLLNFVPMGTATRLVESDEFLNGCLDLHCTDDKIYVVGYSLEIETVADGSRSPAGVAVFDIATREWEAGLLGVNTIQHVFRVNDDPRTHGVNTIVTGLDAAFGVATNQSFEIQTRSYWMENRTTGGDVLTLNVSGLSGLAVDDRGDGTYGVAWSTTAAGNAVPLDVVVNSLAAREGPFLLDIEPEAADVTQTSMEENFPTANVSAVGWVGFAVRDSYGNVRASAADMVAGTITRLDSGANVVPVSFALDTTTGMRRMYHNITLVGAYRLSLSINGLVVPNHPVDLILTPAVVSGPQSEIVNKDVPGLVGTAGALRLIGRDAFSNLVTVGGATIGVSFRVGGTNVPVVIADYGNGTYDIQYTAGIPAVYTLDVDVNGAPAADSPFSFTIQALCNPGDFAETAIGPCTPCEGGSYTDQINLDACLLCPADTISPARAASLQACACSPGFYAEATGIACDPCPEGALCAGDLTPPEALPGYFPAESVEDGLVFLPCPVADACLGGAPLECAEGYMGAACAECSADFYKLAGTCRECSGSGVALLVLFALACVVFCAFLVWLNAQDRKINRFAALAIGINSLQISAIYGQLNVNWPEVVASLLNVLSFANFNLELTSPECSLGASSFYLKWYITMLLPIYFALCFGIVYACGFAYLKCVGSGEGFRAKHPQFTAPPGDSRSSRCRYRCSKCFTDANLTPKTLRHTIVRSFYQILVIAYLPLTAATIKFYACEERDGAHYFQTEPAQPCYDGKYWRSLVPAIVFTVLYPIGIPAYIVGLLRYKAKSMEEFKFYLRYGYFVGRYKTEYYLYETAIMLRKFGVVVAMLFATQDEAVRIGLAITVLFASHVIHMRLDPYNARVHNAIESVSLISAMFVLFCGALLDDEKYASSSLLTALILIAIIGTLLAIAVAIAFDLARLSEEEGAEDMDAIDAMNFGRDTVDGKGDIPSFAIEMSSVASETPNSLFHIDNDDGTLATGFDRRRETNEMNPFESTQGGVILAPVDSRPSSLMASGFTMTNIHSDGTMTDDVITGTMHSLEQFASGPDPIHTAVMSSVARPAPPKRPRPPGSRAATVVDDDTAPMTYVEWEDGSDDDGVEFKM